MTFFNRTIIQCLKKWMESTDRKPLVLRGARQVGKTTAIKMFAKEFSQFIYLNLEKPDDAGLFNRDLSVQELFQAILLHKNVMPKKGKILLFIDEIQQSDPAISYLRFFYEEMPEIFIISAGSLFEIMLETKQISFPVGRIQYLFIYPLTFAEFLEALGEKSALKIYHQIPFPEFGHQKLLKLFHSYTLIGGMPEIVASYREHKDINELSLRYQSLLTAYKDDVSKYARNSTLRNIIKYCLESVPAEAGKRIKFAGFGHSNYRSREIGEALGSLERAMLIYLLHPSTVTKPPLIQDKKKSPRLQFLDTGLLNYVNGLQGYFFQNKDLHSFYKGILAEHIIAHELMAAGSDRIFKPSFWVREKKQSLAEVDFIYPFDQWLIPVEVKAGKSGTLRSLHQYITRCDHNYAVRLYSGALNIERGMTMDGTKYFLLNLPYFLTGKLREYCRWFLDEMK